jgi:phenylacetate-CoA ligase
VEVGQASGRKSRLTDAGSTIEPRSDVAGITWPAIASARGAVLLTLQSQLRESEWWSPERIEEHQFQQLASVLRHARETVPFYQRRFRDSGFNPDKFAPEKFRRLPLLNRSEVQTAADALASTAVPAQHGAIREGQTSGSTGTPVRFKGTELTQLMWEAFTLREVLWHQRDLSARYGVIRMGVKEVVQPGWGPATEAVTRTGPAAFLPVDTAVSAQVAWLIAQQPNYLLTYASNLHALALHCLEHSVRLPFLREVSSLGEVVTAEIRRDCARAWDVRLVDMYTAQEIGYLALQCPEHEHYHVQSENVLLEVLRGDGSLCSPGEVGRVVATTLHNFAMPLIRYDLGDYAEVGEASPCGRGLPVFKRVLGRVRNMLTLPDGAKRWPLVGCRGYGEPWLIRQFQFTQRSLEEIEVKLVTGRPLTEPEEGALKERILESLGHPFKLKLVYCDQIARSPSGKFEDFRSELVA